MVVVGALHWDEEEEVSPLGRWDEASAATSEKPQSMPCSVNSGPSCRVVGIPHRG